MQALSYAPRGVKVVAAEVRSDAFVFETASGRRHSGLNFVRDFFDQPFLRRAEVVIKLWTHNGASEVSTYRCSVECNAVIKKCSRLR